MSFLESIRGAVEAAGEKVERRTSEEPLPAGLRDVPGVISFFMVKEASGGEKHRLALKLVADAGEHAGKAAWASTTYDPTNEKTLSFLVRLLLAAGQDPAAVLADFEGREDDTEGISNAAGAAMLGARVVFETKANTGRDNVVRVEAKWLSEVTEDTPPAEIEVDVAGGGATKRPDPLAGGKPAPARKPGTKRPAL